MLAVQAAASRSRRHAADALHRHDQLAALTWHPARAAERQLRRARVWLVTWQVRRDPDRWARRYLDAAWYVAGHPDAAAPGTDVWCHYRDIGVPAGDAPNPVFDVAGYRFDEPDVGPGDDPLRHWVLVGRRRGATPHPLFDPAWYRANTPGIGRMDPYLHFLTAGRAAGRRASAAVEPGADITTASIAFAAPGAAAVTIIVPAYRRYALTLRCLAALAGRALTEPSVRVVVVDDDPEHPLAPLLGAIPGLEIRTNPRNLGFLRSVNRAVAGTESEYVVILNNDTVVEDGWLEASLLLMTADPTTGMVGSRLLEPNGRLQEAGVTMYQDADGTPYGAGDDPERPQYRFVRDVDCVSGACLLVRREAWSAVGGFDDAFAPAFFEEYDLAFALRAAGWRVRYQPASRVIHAGSASYGVATRDQQTARNRERFRAKWSEVLAQQASGPADEFVARERPWPAGTILVVDDRVPEHDRHAGALWIAQWMELLSEAGYKVIFAPDDGLERVDYAEGLRQSGIEILAPDVDLDAWLDANGRFLDWVLLARPLVADRRLAAVRRWTRARVLYFTHDLHWLREERRHAVTGDPRAQVDSIYLREMETRIFRSVDGILTPSEDEVPLIAGMAPLTPVWVLTPYADRVAAAQPADALPLRDRHVVLFVGGFAHLPNVDAALLLVREVMPLVWASVPEARVVIVGDAPPPELRELASPRVDIAGHVPDLAGALAHARMTVSPLRFGSGVKGKIITSLGAGVPVVTTSVGDEGLGLRHGTEALLADTPEGLAAQVVRLFLEPDLPDVLAAGGRRFLEQRFSADRTRETLIEALGPRRTPG